MAEPSIDEQINAAFGPASAAFSEVVFFKISLLGVDVPLVVLWLVAGAIFFTIYFRGINLRGIPMAMRILKGDFDEEDAIGEISHFRALTTALSGTVGIGNIGGVAIAISVGGPGATFWMVVAGLLGMATKFIECHARRAIPPGERGWLGFRRADVLSARRARGTRHAEAWSSAGQSLCGRHRHRLPGYWEHVSGQPSVRGNFAR